MQPSHMLLNNCPVIHMTSFKTWLCRWLTDSLVKIILVLRQACMHFCLAIFQKTIKYLEEHTRNIWAKAQDKKFMHVGKKKTISR